MITFPFSSSLFLLSNTFSGRRAYYAAITGMDEEIGKLLQGLIDAGLEGSARENADVKK